MFMELAYSLSGFAVGILVGLTGVGGGALMTPILVLLFGFAPVTAVGTDLWFAAITKIVGGTVHAKNDTVDWQVVRRLAYGSVPAAMISIAALQYFGVHKAGNGLLTNMLAIALIISAVAMLVKARLHRIGRELRTEVPAIFIQLQPPLTILAGAILGVLVTFTSVGSGSLCVVMLLYLYPFRMNSNRLVGTDIVHAIPLAVIAGLGHLWMGNVNFSLLGLLLLGSIPGVLIGARLSIRVPDTLLRSSIAVMLVAVATKLLA